MRWIAGLVGVIVAACAPMAPPQPVVQPAVEKPTPGATQEACLAQGGAWAPICRMQRPQCVLTFKDAGKPCTGSDQCQGSCYADPATGPRAGEPATGACSVNSNPCGCNVRVEDGKALPVMCID